MSIDDLLAPKPASHYRDLTQGGHYAVDLNQDEACVVLKVHDYGVDALASDEKTTLHSLIGKLKDQVWP
jgi:hypothetical protein